MSGVEPRNRSEGGIVRGAGARATGRGHATAADLVTGLRRRWTSGIAVVTASDDDGGWRGITVTSLMVVSITPPVVALAVTQAGSFGALVQSGRKLGVSFLEAGHEFAADRFAGRAPVPDARLSGIRHHLEDGVPILVDAIGWCVGRVGSRDPVGDHLLVLLQVERGALGIDTDDPLLSYEGRYRRLEAG